MADLVDLFRPFEHLIFVVSRSEILDGNKDKSGAAEKKLYLAVIQKAIEDFQYFGRPNLTPEQRKLGRDAFTWLYLERADNLSDLYVFETAGQADRAVSTCLDTLCSWLETDPNQLRKKLITDSALPILSLFF